MLAFVHRTELERYRKPMNESRGSSECKSRKVAATTGCLRVMW